jgi:phosphate-selective porin OprO/OprP
MLRSVRFLPLFGLMLATTVQPAAATDLADFNGFTWSQPEAGASLRLTGRAMVDYRQFDHEGTADTFTFRRVRFGFAAILYQDFGLRVEVDATDDVTLADGFVNYRQSDALQLQAGQFKVPFSFDELASSLFFDLQERSLLTNLAHNRDRGVMVHGQPQPWISYALGVFNGSGVNVNETEPEGGHDVAEGKDVAARLTTNLASLLDLSNMVLHLGIAATAGEQAAGVAESGTTPARGITFFAPQETAADFDRRRIGLELAVARGPVKLQSEWAHESLESDDLDADIDAAYVALSWWVTGESFAAAYNPDGFGRTRPVRTYSQDGRGFGAVELSVRLSRFDAGDFPAIAGQSREATEASVGAVWVIHPNVRLVTTYFRTEFDEPVTAGDGTIDHEHAVEARLQIDI